MNCTYAGLLQLPYRVRWQDLKDLFRRAGTVLRADVSLGPDNRSRGYGTVLLATAEDAGRAIDMFNGYSWQTRILEVRPDRLPPDFDANIAPGYPSVAGTGPVPSSIPPSSSSTPFPDDLDYSSLLDHYYNLPSTSGPPSRNLFVGNVGPQAFSQYHSLFAIATLPLPMARLERLVSSSGYDHSG